MRQHNRVANISESSARSERHSGSRIAWAFVLSMTVHMLVFGGYYAGRELGIWQRLHLPDWLKKANSAKALAELIKKNEAQRQEEMPLIFVDVSSAQATPEPPKTAK